MQIKVTKESMLRKHLRRRVYCVQKVKAGIPLFKAAWHHNVVLGPSNVSGLGVFTTRRIKAGEVVCIYSGKMSKTNPGCSNYVLKGKLWNKGTKKHDIRHIDAKSLKTGIGRFLNDACDGYSENFPAKYRTPYYTNCGYRHVIHLG